MDNNIENDTLENATLQRYLSPLGVWALSFGCAVGWGAFVMPGTTFLPIAGPLGTALGIAVGAVVMLIIGMNYYYLMNRYPNSGGALTYTINTFGYDHGFLNSWFLVLVYVAIVWANATALVLIGRNLLGDVFQFGFHYKILDYDVYFGEALLSIVFIVLFGCICIFGKRLARVLQIIFALVLFGGIVVCFVMVMSKHEGGLDTFSPAFAEGDRPPFSQIFGIVALAPWAFVGFESVSHSVEEFKFPVKKTIFLILAALVTSALSYIMLSEIAAAFIPDGYDSWSSYIDDIGNLSGLKSLPVFYNTNHAVGKYALVLMVTTVLSGILTGLIGHFIAASRLIYAMSKENILPKWFGGLNKHGVPQNAMLFLMIISVFIPFFGRTAIGWIVDVTTIGATIVYGYTSAVAYVLSKRQGDNKIKATGLIGLIASIGFFIYFMAFSAGAMSTESYLILAIWGILGFVYFRYVFSKDTEKHFGKSTVVWLGLLFLIFFTSLMWVKQATNNMTEQVVMNISDHYEKLYPDSASETDEYLDEQMTDANHLMTRNSIIQMIIIVVGLGIMFNIYTIMSKREKALEVEKIKAEENSKAKTVFLSNMSHDIRTPMNAIIGYINIAEHEENGEKELREYLGKIKNSSHHLLALINDVLEMSRIESGKMDLEPVEIDLKKTLDEVKDMFSTQMERKNIDFFVDASQIKNRYVYCDKNRFNRVLLNLISNAYKFTPNEGVVSVTAWQIGDTEDGYGRYELRVADSGIGMTKEFAEKVFEAFERERTSTVSGIQGTGLGMAITKSIIDLMGGTIEVNTAPDCGTEFVIRVKFKLVDKAKETDDEAGAEDAGDVSSKEKNIDFSKMRLLLVDDMEINREIAEMLLEELGFTIETAENGKEALDKVAASTPGYYDVVLMDIQMPVMDGYTATENIRKLDNRELANVPIVAMTANAFSEDVKKAKDTGMNAHIAKPIDMDNVVNTLKEVLG
ncbi:MAG: amino acid permease [Lachnospiraceae bacterium]|nr:amino acid permease [Lachnospiraceae bacterium]